MDRYADIIKRLPALAAEDSGIRFAGIIGSAARENTPADEYSDLDVLLATETPERWFSGEYPAALGNLRISFIEPTFCGGREYRCVYDADRDVDWIVLTPAQLQTALSEGVAAQVMNRGFRVLYDSGGFSEQLARCVETPVSAPEMTAEEFSNTVNDFFFHNLWAVKKLRRGELWKAELCVDGYLKNLLLRMLEQYCADSRDVWHDGRFLDRWAPPDVTEELKNCFSRYDPDGVLTALRHTCRLFARLARAVAEKKGFPYPEDAERCALEFIGS